MIISGKDIVFASKLIKEGKLVAFPTETVYGLGANGLNAEAVARIFEVKKRPFFDPVILHIAKIDDLNRVFKSPVSQLIMKLAKKYWPGPLTIVAPKQDTIPDIVTSGLTTVAVRMPDNQMALKLIRLAGVPVAAPSANLFGKLSPTTPDHVKKQLSNIDYLLDGGQTKVGIESTIISVIDNTIEILRSGIITSDQLTTDFPEAKLILNNESDNIKAPGQMKIHYSPNKPLFLINKLPEELPVNIGVLLFNSIQIPKNSSCKIIYLSKKGDLIEAASNLFSALHKLENDQTIETIYAFKVNEEGVGQAIMDKLYKASYKYANDGGLPDTC